ncbi:chaperone NapD [Azoarcus sp. PA01]|nr:chaperone NapD [Azoarcus sp. PA01]
MDARSSSPWKRQHQLPRLILLALAGVFLGVVVNPALALLPVALHFLFRSFSARPGSATESAPPLVADDFPEHVPGILVETEPARTAEVARAIAAVPELDICTINPAGKLAVISDCTRFSDTLELISWMRELPGVVTVTPVYHRENADAANDASRHRAEERHTL